MAKEKPNSEGNAVQNTKSNTITIDTLSSEVLKFDQAGVELIFDDSPEKFKPLTKEEMELLSSVNKARYRIAYAVYKLNCEERDNPSPTKNLSGNGRVSAPRTRFYVDPKTKNPAYKYSWITPNMEYNALLNGAEVVNRETDPTLRYTGGVVSKEGTPTIGVPGRTEQILVRYPKELYRKNIELPPAIKSQKMNLTYEEKGAAEITAAGGKPFTSDEFKDKSFREVSGK